MASHLRQPDEQGDARPQGREQQGGYQQPTSYQRTYDGSSAPRPVHMAPGTTTSVGYQSIVTESQDGRDARGRRRSSAKRNNRRRERSYRQTDPYDIAGRRSKSPWKRLGRVLSTLLFIVGVGLIVYAAYTYLYAQYQYYLTDENNEALAEYATVSDDASTAPVVDWEALKAVNDDVVGWVYIPGTVVNYPVYQADDNSYYLHTTAEGEYSVGGQIFLDYANTAPGLVDYQSVIYGHHLRNGAMFEVIADMTNQEMFDSVVTVWYVTEDATYELVPLLTYEIDEEDTDAGETVRTFTFDSVEDYQSYLLELLAISSSSAENAEELIATGANVLSLCTCTYDSDFDEGRGRAIFVCIVTDVTYTSADDDATDDASADDATDEATDTATEADSDETS